MFCTSNPYAESAEHLENLELRMTRIDIGILGATGMVGQQFIALLADHPWFRVAWLGASQRSEGKAYRDSGAWRLSTPLSNEVASLSVDAATPGRAPHLVFSALDSSVAGEIDRKSVV